MYSDKASKTDLGKFLSASGTVAAVKSSYVDIASLKLSAGHTYLVIGHNQVTVSLPDGIMSTRLNGFNSANGTYFYSGEARTTGINGGGCESIAVINVIKEHTITLQGYGHSDKSYSYSGKLFAVQLI